MIGLLHAHGWEIGRLTFEHLWLTLSAMLLAAGIVLPLGILLTLRERLAKPLLDVSKVIPTVTSLALFGHLFTAPMLRENTATMANHALPGYALLPHLR